MRRARAEFSTLDIAHKAPHSPERAKGKINPPYIPQPHYPQRTRNPRAAPAREISQPLLIWAGENQWRANYSNIILDRNSLAPHNISHPHNSIPYPIHPSVNKPEKENLPEAYKVVLSHTSTKICL